MGAGKSDSPSWIRRWLGVVFSGCHAPPPPKIGWGSSHTLLFLVLTAGVLFYLPGLLPGRVLLPADILCSVLPWQATAQCAGQAPANPVISDQVFQFFAWRSVVKTHGWPAVFWNPYAFAGSPMAG